MKNLVSLLFGRKQTAAAGNPAPVSMAQSAQGNATPEYAHTRRYPRFYVEGMDIHSKMMHAEPVHLSNISVGGACIVSSVPFRSGKNVLIRINRDKIPHPLLGTVIWEGKSGGACLKEGVQLPLYRAGIQFRNVPPGTLVQLKDFMRVAGIPQETPYVKTDKQIALRYVITKDDGALLNYSTSYIVKKISMSGMLVGASHEFVVDQKYPMALLLPNENHPVKLIGRIASLYRFPGRESLFDIGIEFQDLTEQGKTRLKRFIASLLWKQEA